MRVCLWGEIRLGWLHYPPELRGPAARLPYDAAVYLFRLFIINASLQVKKRILSFSFGEALHESIRTVLFSRYLSGQEVT